jgi:hypothetical protein
LWGRRGPSEGAGREERGGARVEAEAGLRLAAGHLGGIELAEALEALSDPAAHRHNAHINIGHVMAQ